MIDLPNGTVTFLFTDIEGSTRLAREYPDLWEDLHARHDAILREAIESNHGFVFQNLGDAFCSAFHKPGDALHAALKAQRDLQSEPWRNAAVRVRMESTPVKPRHTGKIIVVISLSAWSSV